MKNLIDEIKLTKPVKKSLFFHDVKVITKTIIFEALLVLVGFGICYLGNFRIKIEPIVQIVSPLVK